jgi:KUP system potassium uptake protein
VADPVTNPPKRVYNEAAHKLLPYGDQPVREEPDEPEAAAERDRAQQSNDDVVPHAGRAILALGALGVVYGDLGTSPLYTEQVTFGFPAAQRADATDIYGVVSLIFWALTIIVSIKYAGFIMRAHNRGDGGIMALAALCRRYKVGSAAFLVTLGIFGAALFFGDGMITPAISVLSAVSGLGFIAPGLTHLIVPISVVILIGLFLIQQRGTDTVGWLFGPVMLLWFATLMALGLARVIPHPAVLQAFSPVWGVRFFLNHGIDAFLALGGVVLCVTGAEALYADRGHFGPTPIRLAWFLVVFPGVVLDYLGQAVWIQEHPRADLHISKFNPFYSIVPGWAEIPMVILATVATIIASQAVISGSYSVARQAMQLGYLPRITVRHTSEMEGQIYVPMINWVLCVGVVGLVLAFQNSNGLANAYGVAVTGTFVLNTTLFLFVARAMWHTPRWRLAILGTLFLAVEVTLLAANMAKILHGAWLPLAAAALASIVMLTWRRGRDVVTDLRLQKEGSLEEFIDELCAREVPVRRVPGTAIFLNPGDETTPLALRAQVERIHALQERVLLVSVDQANVPRVRDARRFIVRRVGHGVYQFPHVTIRFGYRERQDVPRALRLARKQGLLERNLDLEGASYFLSRITLTATDEPTMSRWRKKTFLAMARNASSPIEHFALPVDQTVSVGSQIMF